MLIFLPIIKVSWICNIQEKAFLLLNTHNDAVPPEVKLLSVIVHAEKVYLYFDSPWQHLHPLSGGIMAQHPLQWNTIGTGREERKILSQVNYETTSFRKLNYKDRMDCYMQLYEMLQSPSVGEKEIYPISHQQLTPVLS